MRERSDDDLRLTAPALGEKRPHGTIDQARDQGFLLGGATFAFEIAARNAPGRVELFLVIDGQGQEVDAFPGFFRSYDRRQYTRVAVTGDHCAVGLPCNLAGL